MPISEIKEFIKKKIIALFAVTINWVSYEFIYLHAQYYPKICSIWKKCLQLIL